MNRSRRRGDATFAHARDEARRGLYRRRHDGTVGKIEERAPAPGGVGQGHHGPAVQRTSARAEAVGGMVSWRKDVESDMDRTVPQPHRLACALVTVPILALATACSSKAGPASTDGPNATVLEVIDGDTIEADIGGRRERVRLLGIDTPEVAHAATSDHPATVGECFGDEATAFTESLIPPGAQVRLERDVVGRDHYGRILAHIHSGELHVNREIVRRGFATPLIIEPNGIHRHLIVAAATAAEADDVGLWANCG